MKLLVVMQWFPWPPRTGSALVAYNSIKELSKRHSVSLICRERPQSEGELAEVLVETRYPDGRPVALRRRLQKLLLMLRGIPQRIADTASRPMEIAVAESAGRFDALVLFEFQAIQYCPASARRIMIANIEDPPSIKSRLYSRLSVYSLRERLHHLLDALLLAHYERRVLPSLARVLLLSRMDMNAMCLQGGYLNLGHVSYGTLARKPEDVAGWTERTRGAIVFSGNMWHGPNVDGALFFLREVFDRVLQKEPSAVLWIVGANPDRRIVEAAHRFSGQVTITGQVPDIAAYVSRACVSICPVRVKVGVQTKVLEALSAGTPVVSTAAGNAGIGGVSGTHLWVEDEPERFAGRVVELLRGQGWSRMSKEGRELVLDGFSWERSAATLEEYLAEAGESSGTTSGEGNS